LKASDVTLNPSTTVIAGTLVADIATVLNLGAVDTLAVSNTVDALFANNLTLEIASVETAQPTALIPWTVESNGSIILTGDVTDDGDVTVSCFAAGTRIGTPNGQVAVERLVVGDIVSLADGGAAPITWIGQRRIDCRRHPASERVWPVGVSAHAFGLGRPNRTVFLSPDHAVFIEDVLVPVKLLLNGTTIRQVRMAEVTYYHLELARHDVVLAEGLPVETYLDTGGRTAFEGGVVALHPEFGAPDDVAVAIWREKGFAPLIGDVAVLERVRVRLAVQASLLTDRRAG
jgi:Hint domain